MTRDRQMHALDCVQQLHGTSHILDSLGEHCPVGVSQLPVNTSQDAAGAGFAYVFPVQVAVQVVRPVQSGKLTAEEDELGRPEQGRCVAANQDNVQTYNAGNVSQLS